MVNTNSYAAEKRGKNPVKEREKGFRRWEPVGIGELQCWIGIIIYMGVVDIPAVKDYWKGGLYPDHGWTSYLSATRFEEIKRYFHISQCSDTPEQPPHFWHHKVDPLLNQLQWASQQYRLPSTNITLDEAMIRCTGRSKDITKMKGKPIEVGYKFHYLADHGYVWLCHPYSGSSGIDPVPSPSPPIPGLGHAQSTASMAYFMATQLPYRDHSFNLYCDNFYTSLGLFSALRDIGIGACGTARANTKDFPSQLNVPKKSAQAKQLEYNMRSGVISAEGGVATLLWNDNGPVTMMTTLHTLKGRAASVQRVQ